MSDAVISVENLGKKYRISHQQQGRRYVALRDVIADSGRSILGRLRMKRGKTGANGANGHSHSLFSAWPATEDFWALQNVSFEVKRGEVIGIIGRNGAGKSTLLKILSRITESTVGRVVLRGRVASLLEVGTGFHPELTGRENIYLNGAILGMHRVEIKKKFDEIVAFAEVAKFLDTPVKRYSSGMYVRLAFAVAAHLEPEILVVDEVLAVGDASFQKKCLGKLQDVAGKEGRTVLFVSHNIMAIRSLCSRGILLKAGILHQDGPIDKAIETYLEEKSDAVGEVTWNDPRSAPRDNAMRLAAVRIRSEGEITSSVFIDEAVNVEIDYETLEAELFASVAIHVHILGTCAFVGGPASSTHGLGLHRAICTIPANLLNNGTYHVSCFLITNTTNIRVIKRDVITFDVHEKEREEYMGEVMGTVRPNLEWSVGALEREPGSQSAMSFAENNFDEKAEVL
jgi:lipopolysaccharide transport system ATP-binding protein